MFENDEEHIENIEQSGRSERKSRQKDEKGRVRRLWVLLLLLLLILVGFIVAFILSYMPPPKLRQGKIVSEFSIYGFNRPLAVSTDDKQNIYVSDTGHARFYVFDKNGNYIRRIGNDKREQRFYGVFGSRVDSKSGRIYISDWKRRAINVFTIKGKFIKRFPKSPANISDFGLRGFSPFGMDYYKNKIYVTSFDGIYIFSNQGKLLKKIGAWGRPLGNFDYPSQVAVDKKDGSIYVTDQLNRRVVALSPKGVPKWSLGHPDTNGRITSFFSLPRGIAIDKQGRIYVTDSFYHTITVLNRDGKLLSVMGKRGTEDAKFNFPEGIVFDKDGRLILADRENNRVQVLRITGLSKPTGKQVKKYQASFIKAPKDQPAFIKTAIDKKNKNSKNKAPKNKAPK